MKSRKEVISKANIPLTQFSVLTSNETDVNPFFLHLFHEFHSFYTKHPWTTPQHSYLKEKSLSKDLTVCSAWKEGNMIRTVSLPCPLSSAFTLLKPSEEDTSKAKEVEWNGKEEGYGQLGSWNAFWKHTCTFVCLTSIPFWKRDTLTDSFTARLLESNLCRNESEIISFSELIVGSTGKEHTRHVVFCRRMMASLTDCLSMIMCQLLLSTVNIKDTSIIIFLSAVGRTWLKLHPTLVVSLLSHAFV